MSYPVMLQHEKAGKQHLKEGHYSDAGHSFQAALRETEKYKEPNAYRAQQVKNLGVFYLGLCDYEKAEPLFKQSLAMERNLLGNDNLEICKSLNHIGLLYQLKEDFPHAESVYQQAVNTIEHTPFKKWPEIDTKLHYLSVHLLAIVNCNVGKQEEARRLCEKAAREIEQIDTKDRETFLKLHHVASRYLDIEQHPEAKEEYRLLLQGFAENLQLTFLGTIIKGDKPSLIDQKPETDIQKSIHELIAEYEEVWRPAKIFHEPASRELDSTLSSSTKEESPHVQVEPSKQEDDPWRP